MAGANGVLGSLVRQWHRIQLARELLEQYEYEEEHRISFGEAIRRIEAGGMFTHTTSPVSANRWRDAVMAKADRYPHG